MVTKKATPAKKTAAVVVEKLKRHPLSEKYGPKMSAEEQLAIGTDMKQHGQHEKIILHEGMVLAGWNRYMGGLQQGMAKELKFRNLEPNENPVAVAFGTNFVRRRLSSVQKAFFGAQFAVDTGAKQTDVAKLMACNLNRLNQCSQLIKQGTDANGNVLDTPAGKAITTIRDNPDLSGGAFDELMLEVGIARPAPPPPAPARTNTHADLDDGDDPLEGLEDDLTGGAIDELLDDPGGDEETKPAATKRKEIGEGVEPLPAVGTRPSKMTNPHETPVSRVAKAFKGLSAEEQRTFVKFAWGKLKAALDAAIKGNDVEYVAPEPGPVKPDPSIIARAPKPKGKAKKDIADATEISKAIGAAAAKKATTKKAAPAKKAAAKKGAK